MRGFGLFREEAVDEVAGHAAFLEGVVDRMRDERDAARAALAESEAARANLEAIITKALESPHDDSCSSVLFEHRNAECDCWQRDLRRLGVPE